MQSLISADPKVKQISDAELIAAAKAAQDRHADVITVIRKHLPTGKLPTCPSDKREALVNDLAISGCPADAIPLFEKLAEVAKDHAGQFVLVGFRDGLAPSIEHVTNDSEAVPNLIAAAARLNVHNSYSLHIAPALFRDDLAPGSRGGARDVVAMLAIVTDFDRHDAPETRKERLIFAPWCESESSPGNFHSWIFLDAPYPVAEAGEIISAVHRIAKVADNTDSPDHLYRLPGSINVPTESKIKSGKRDPGVVYAKLHLEAELADLTAPNVSLVQIRAAIINKHGAGALIVPVKATAAEWTDASWSARACPKYEVTVDTIRDWLNTPLDIPKGMSHGKGEFRSQGLSSRIYSPLRMAGWTPQEVFEVIAANADTGFGMKAMGEKGAEWLRADIIRWWKKQPAVVPADFTEAVAKLAPEKPDKLVPDTADELEAAVIERQQAEAELAKPGVVYTARDFEAEQKKLDEYLDLFNRHFCLANVGSIAKQTKIIEFTKNGKILHFMDQDDFRLRFRPMRVWLRRDGGDPKWHEVSQIWLTWANRRHYLDDGLVFAPGEPMEWEGGLNRWRGFAIEPKAGDWSPILDLIERVLCSDNAEVSEYLLSWLAHMVQRPGVLIGSCIALRSDHEGAGKGTLGKTIGSFFGPNYAYIQRGADFTGRFNGSLAETLFAVLDEAMFAGDHEASEMLKTLVSDDQRRTEQKNLPVEYIQNHINVMIFGNNEWLVRTGLKNRRFVYIDIPETYPPNDPYWSQFYIEQDHAYRPGVKHKLPPLAMRQAMLHDLLHRDITKFDPRTIPHTLEEGRQKVLSMSGVQGYIYAMLQDGAIEFPSQSAIRTSTRPWHKDGLTIRRSDFHNALCHYWTTRRERGPVPSRDSVGRALQRLLPLCVKENRTRDRVVNPDYSHCYNFAPLDTCRAAFDMAFGSPNTWDTLPEFEDIEQEATPELDKELGIVSEASDD